MGFRLIQFLIIVGAIFLLEMPGCFIVVSDEAGGINYFEHEGLIEFSKATFAAPLRHITGPPNSMGALLLIYVGNVLFLATIVFLIINGSRKLRILINQKIRH